MSNSDQHAAIDMVHTQEGTCASFASPSSHMRMLKIDRAADGAIRQGLEKS